MEKPVIKQDPLYQLLRNEDIKGFNEQREQLDTSELKSGDYRGRAGLSVFIQVDDQPLFTVTGRHRISEIVTLCGGRNVFADLPGLAPAVDLEAVIARNPEAILYAGAGSDPAAAWRRYAGITAVRRSNVFPVPPDEIARATPRILGGARRVCESLERARTTLADAVD